jgi:hypothetical protein
MVLDLRRWRVLVTSTRKAETRPDCLRSRLRALAKPVDARVDELAAVGVAPKRWQPHAVVNISHGTICRCRRTFNPPARVASGNLRAPEAVERVLTVRYGSRRKISTAGNRLSPRLCLADAVPPPSRVAIPEADRRAVHVEEGNAGDGAAATRPARAGYRADDRQSRTHRPFEPLNRRDPCFASGSTKCGMPSATNTPMMSTTTRISINVNPRSRTCSLPLITTAHSIKSRCMSVR